MNKIQIFCTLALLLISLSSICQTNTLIEGRLICKTSKNNIANAHIICRSSELVFTSASLGYFNLSIAPIDTLYVSALGYTSGVFIINKDSSDIENKGVILQLIAKSYLLAEVDIHSLGTWDEFKANFLKTEIKSDKDKINKNILRELKEYNTKAKNIIPSMYRTRFNKPPSLIQAFVRPTDYLYYKLSKTAQRKIKLAKMIRQAKKDKVSFAKFNTEIIQDLTKLKQKDLEEFIIYCNTKLLANDKTNACDILSQILKLYDVYKRTK